MRTMKRKDYQKPTVTTFKLQFKCQILAGSNGVPWWGGEGGARGMRRTSDDEDLE